MERISRIKIYITSHAVEKYQNIFSMKNLDGDEIRKRILNMFLKADEIKQHPAVVAQRMLNNKKPSGYKEAKYFEYGQYRMVIVDDAMVTFEKKFKSRRKKK